MSVDNQQFNPTLFVPAFAGRQVVMASMTKNSFRNEQISGRRNADTLTTAIAGLTNSVANKTINGASQQ